MKTNRLHEAEKHEAPLCEICANCTRPLSHHRIMSPGRFYCHGDRSRWRAIRPNIIDAAACRRIAAAEQENVK